MAGPGKSGKSGLSAGSSRSWDAQKRDWAILERLRPFPLELERVHRIRNLSPERLLEDNVMETLMLELGLNGEGRHELPGYLHPACGFGLRIWQYPIQFAPYLRCLSQLRIRSYLEIGIRHGGSYVLTVEMLNRFSTLDWAVGVDVIPCPSMNDYTKLNERSTFAQVNSQSPAFAALCERLAPIDLVFIDSHHAEHHCRREVETVRPFAAAIALHDISNIGWPGVATVWGEIVVSNEYECIEFIEQYDSFGPYMGIGLAVRKDRSRLATRRGRAS